MNLVPVNLENESRAGQIISLIARRHEATVAELVDDLGVTATAVRQQLHRLVDQGWLERARPTKGPGRPADVFSLSERSKRLFAVEVDEFARLLMDEIVAADGHEKLQYLLGRVRERIAGQLEQAVGHGEPGQQIVRLAELLQRKGTVANAEPDSQGTARLNVFTCPYHGLEAGEHQLCELERDTLAKITGGEVRLEHRLVDGHACCEFRFESRASDERVETETE